MRGARTLVLAASILGSAAAAATAGTVTMTTSVQGQPVNSCTAGPTPNVFWPVVVQASSTPIACDYRVPFVAVPPNRAADITSAHASAPLFGVSGFEFGILAADDGVAGSVAIPAGANVVQSQETAVPLMTAGGTVTLVLRAASGMGEVWLAPSPNLSVAVTVLDVAAPTIVGAVNPLPAHVLRSATSVPVAVRFSDGAAIGGATATIAWGDGHDIQCRHPLPRRSV